MNSNIKIIAIDLDGTLFNAKKEVTAENRAALKAAHDKGVKIVITTGRPLAAIGNLLSDLGLSSFDDYSITFNGGLVQRNTGDILTKQTMDRADIEWLHEHLDELGLPFDVLSDHIVYSLPSKGIHSKYPEANPMLTFVNVDKLVDIPLDVPYNKVVTVTDATYLDQQLAKLPKEIYSKYEAFKSRDIIFEIMPKGVTKATGLDLLCQHLGLTAENVMSIGDEENDIPMLEWAGLGVAMANATDKVKAIADVVTSHTNEHSGVAEAIQKYVLGEDN